MMVMMMMGGDDWAFFLKAHEFGLFGSHQFF